MRWRRRADDPIITAEVDQGKTIKIDVLAKRGALPAAKLTSVTPLETDYGTVALSADARSVTFQAKERPGETTLSYMGSDTVNGGVYNGKITISVVAAQRIVTFDALRVGGVLGIILVLAIVLEIGLSTLFNWKYFQEHLQDKGLRTPIAIAAAGFFVYHYKLDTVADLLSAFTRESESSFGRTTPGQGAMAESG